MFTSLITDKQTNKQSNRGQVDNIMSAPACLVWHRHYVCACLSGLAQALCLRLPVWSGTGIKMYALF